MEIAPPCQQTDPIPIAAHQRFLLRPRPSLALSFGLDRVRDRIEMLRECQRDGPALGRVATEYPRVVLGHTRLKLLTRGADIIAAVGALKNVEKRAVHGPPHPSRRRAARGSSG